MARQWIYSGSKYEELAGYARAVVDGRFVFVSGTVGADFKTGAFADGAEAQSEQAIANIREALAKAGSSLEDVVRVRVYVPDPADVMTVSRVMKRHFDKTRPANTTICTPLTFPEMRVEIEVTALKPEA
ncbi:MAG: RidA family protein [Proteobacteria bacterium]|nr:RidA family protein [Pseudomonadota bacterium]MBI3499733.1 RidA family protein [Pseudomonadota bacterium]